MSNKDKAAYVFCPVCGSSNHCYHDSENATCECGINFNFITGELTANEINTETDNDLYFDKTNKNRAAAAALFWDEVNGCIYGRVSDFQNIGNFSAAISKDPDTNSYIIKSFEKKLCYVTRKGLEPDKISPVSETDVEMVWFFTAVVSNPGETAYCSCSVDNTQRYQDNKQIKY